MNGPDSSNLLNMNELTQLLSAMISPDQSIPSMDSEAINSLDLYQDFNTNLYKTNQHLMNSSTTSLIHDLWLNATEQNKFDSISQFGTAHWVQQTRTPVTRSHSVITPTLPTSTATSQKDIDMTSSLPVCHELKTQHRSLSRAASDPVTAKVRVTRTDSTLAQSDSIQSNSDTSSADRYKTELCRTFQENGKCKYGDKCQFAHGRAELRNLSRHPKYKTDRCKTYHSTGFCPYGPRCHFVHDENEHSADESKLLQQKLRQPVQQKQQQHQQQLQLLLALLAQSQSNQSLGLSSCDLSGIRVPESVPSTSNLFNSLSKNSGKYSDSLGSTSSPPSSVSDSRSQSPTLSIFDGEQVDILASRSGSLDATAMVRKDLNEWQQTPIINLLSGTRQNLTSPPGFKSYPNSLVCPNGYQQYQNTLSTSITNHSSPSCNLPTSESVPSNLPASRFDAMTLEDVLLIAEVLKAVPTARGKYSAPPFSTLQNFDRLDALTSLAHFPSSGLVL